MCDKAEKPRISSWPPVLLVRRQEKSFLGFMKRQVMFECGHQDLPLLYLEVSDTGFKIKSTTNDMCPACFQQFITQHSTVCADCGDIIMPCGEAVACVHYNSALEKGLIPVGLPPTIVGGKKCAFIHHGHMPGFFSGYWDEEGYVPHDWSKGKEENGVVVHGWQR